MNIKREYFQITVVVTLVLSLFLNLQQTKAQDKSNIFSSWESSWKHKAMEELDSTRIGAWQKELNQEDQTLLNWHLRKELEALGYDNSGSQLKTADKLNIFSEYGSLVARRLTRSVTDLIS